MAKVKVLINGEELKEKKEVIEIIKNNNFNKHDKDRLKGFFQGLAFGASK